MLCGHFQIELRFQIYQSLCKSCESNNYSFKKNRMTVTLSGWDVVLQGRGWGWGMNGKNNSEEVDKESRRK